MLNTLKKIFIVLVSIFIVDRLVGVVVAYAYHNYANTKYTYALNSSDEDILLFGSSRIAEAVNPFIIQDSLNKSCYNLGIGNANIYSSYCMLTTVIQQNNKPDMVILDLTHIDYNDTPDNNTQQLSFFYPLYGKIDSITNLINTYSNDKYIKFKIQSHIYRYNSTLHLPLIENYTRTNGFRNTERVYKKENKSDTNIYSLDKTKILFLEKFINICNENGIKLLILFSPQFKVIKNDAQNIEKMKRILKKYDCTVLDYSQKDEFIRREFFYDSDHSNRVGAEVYTKALIPEIKQVLQLQN